MISREVDAVVAMRRDGEPGVFVNVARDCGGGDPFPHQREIQTQLISMAKYFDVLPPVVQEGGEFRVVMPPYLDGADVEAELYWITECPIVSHLRVYDGPVVQPVTFDDFRFGVGAITLGVAKQGNWRHHQHLVDEL